MLLNKESMQSTSIPSAIQEINNQRQGMLFVECHAAKDNKLD